MSASTPSPSSSPSPSPSPRTELRAQADVASWLAAGLVLRRVPGEAEDDVTVAGSILACASELATMPPPGVIADVATLLGGARPQLEPPAGAGEALKQALRAYDDDVLGRLVQTPRFDDVLAAYAHLPATQRPQAIALVVGALCERAGFAGLSVNPATLRRALARPREERETTGRAELRSAATANRLAEAYQRLARGARQSRALVDDREVFAIDHLQVLGSFARRMAADHIGAAAEELTRTLPRRLPAGRQQRGARDTQLADEDTYPAGGFTAITPGGSSANIENLVSSELVYMEDHQAVDLFTLRYVEGELLFYTRDESVFRRHRHLITFLLGTDLDDARVKDPDVPWQRLVLALGLLVAAIRWLTDQLGHEALAVRLAFPPRRLVEERELVALLLEGEITSGIVQVVEEPAGAAIRAAEAAGATAISDLVLVSLGPVPPLPRGQRALHLSLAAAWPAAYELAPRRGTPLPPEPGTDAWTEWGEVAEDLLRWLV
ncbi:MAG TPA: hypothetical protein VNO30_31015 [Kofleriaceae bacterium]|nr:hypothetical protein [Kofleriaceae bacterium]